jgi:hypothetical protein
MAIVDEAAASKYWPGQSAVGQRLTIDGGGAATTWREIVGVVRTVHHDALDVTPRGALYFPLAQRATTSVFLVIHTSGDAVAVLPSARAAVRDVDPALPVFDARTLDDRLGESLGRRRVATWSIGVFASLALAIIGVYGVLAYDVSQRKREIGTLGADRDAVLRLVMGGGLRMAMLGVAIGAAIAFGLARVASGLLFGVAAVDPPTYGGLAILLLGLAAAAAYVPARRATGSIQSTHCVAEQADAVSPLAMPSATSHQPSSAAGPRLVGIGLRFGMSRRRVAAAPWMRLACTVGNSRPQADLALADFLDQVRDQQRDRQRERNQNAVDHALPPRFSTQRLCPADGPPASHARSAKVGCSAEAELRPRYGWQHA